jgi:hypothetical protein
MGRGLAKKRHVVGPKLLSAKQWREIYALGRAMVEAFTIVELRKERDKIAASIAELEARGVKRGQDALRARLELIEQVLHAS